MNLSKANTRPQAEYWAFHTRFNATLKVATCGFEHLKRTVNHAGGPQVLNGILRGTDEQWNPETIWPNPVEIIELAQRDESLLGIAHALSAFDQYLTSSRADLDSWVTHSSPAKVSTASKAAQPADPDSLGGLASFVKHTNFKKGSIAHLVPFEHYFRLIRNCVVHREGRASSGLVKYASSKEFQDCYDTWNAKAKRSLPPLPVLSLGEHICASPRHAILATSMLFEIVRLLDAHMVSSLGPDGIAFLAARDSLLDGKFVDWNGAYKSPQSVFRT